MRIAISLVATTIVFAADTPADAVKKDMAMLEGEWSMVSGERDGQRVPDDFVKNGKRVSKDGETTVTFGDMLMMKARFSIDPSKKLKEIDYTVTDGPNKGKTQLGIYEIDGDKVTFCFAAPNAKRPTEFRAKEGSNWTLSVWKRNKK